MGCRILLYETGNGKCLKSASCPVCVLLVLLLDKQEHLKQDSFKNNDHISVLSPSTCWQRLVWCLCLEHLQLEKHRLVADPCASLGKM